MASTKKRESKREHDKRIKAEVDAMLQRTAPGTYARRSPAPAPVAAPPLGNSPGTLEAVTEAVMTMPSSGRFGSEKVFISEIWKRVGNKLFPTLNEFKRWLLLNNRQGNLVLARADLIGAMDPTQVQTSEIMDRGAVFHFVLDPTQGEHRDW